MISSLRFAGPGQIILVASADTGSDGPALVWATSRGARQLSVKGPRRARWRSPENVIVQQDDPSRGAPLIEARPREDMQRVVTPGGLTAPEPSPDGKRLAVGRLADTGSLNIEIWRYTDGDALTLVQAHSSRDLPTLDAATAWSPDGTRLAVSVQSDESGRSIPRIAVVETMGRCIRPVARGSEARGDDPGGVVPAFWHQRGIVAISSRGLLLLEPGACRFRVICEAGARGRVVGGTAFDVDLALVLLSDGSDPLERRATQVRSLDLSSGESRVGVDLPPGMFVSDIDWAAL